MKNSSRAICALLAAILAASLFSCSEKKDDSAETSGTAETSGVTDTAADTAPAESSSPKYSLGLAADGKFDGIRASDHVKLCDYKGINIPAENCTVSDEDIDARIKTVISNFRSTLKRTDRAVADGDTVNIDYVGSIDGVEFENGSTGGNGTDVTIGVTSYIDDFLEQLIGHMPGETVNVEVTFPVPYPNNPDLAGKDALFVTEINYITEYADPEFTDDFVKENLYGTYGLSTVAEVREYLENSIREESITQYIKSCLLENSTVDLPDAVYDFCKNTMLNYYTDYASQYQKTLDDYVEAAGYSSVDEFCEANREDLESDGKIRLIFQAIAEAEGLTADEEDVKEYIAKANEGNSSYSETMYDSYITDYGMPFFMQAVLQEKAIAVVTDSAVLGG